MDVVAIFALAQAEKVFLVTEKKEKPNSCTVSANKISFLSNSLIAGCRELPSCVIVSYFCRVTPYVFQDSGLSFEKGVISPENQGLGEHLMALWCPTHKSCLRIQPQFSHTPRYPQYTFSLSPQLFR